MLKYSKITVWFTSSWVKWWEQWWVMLRIRCTQYYRSSWNSRCRGGSMDYLSCHMWYQLGPVLAYSDHRLPCRPKHHLANILEWHWLKNRKKRRKTLEFSWKSVIFVHKASNFHKFVFKWPIWVFEHPKKYFITGAVI